MDFSDLNAVLGVSGFLGSVGGPGDCNSSFKIILGSPFWIRRESKA